MMDKIETIGNGSIIQHGKHNDRVYLMKLDERDSDIIIEELAELAKANNYSKLFCKVPKHIAPLFYANGFILEGYIPEFFNRTADVLFVSKFLNSDRLLNIETEKLNILKTLLTEKHKTKKLTSDYKVRKLGKTDVLQMTRIYAQVFESYPFPIHKAEYLKQTMDENLQYYGAEIGGKLVALASSEIDSEGKNAEMTDFATLPNHAGKNLASMLLIAMEKEMNKQGINTLYTIARLNSIAMNKTFLRCGYNYSGTLVKNTNISGKIESMNIYYKHL